MLLYAQIRTFSSGTLVYSTLFSSTDPHFKVFANVTRSISFCCLVLTLLSKVIAMVVKDCYSLLDGEFLGLISMLVFSTMLYFIAQYQSFC